MESMINVDFSKLEKVEVKPPYKTFWAVCIASVAIVVCIASAMYIICNKTYTYTPFIIVCLSLILSLCLIALCYIIYKVEYIKLSYSIEEKRAESALRRKLVEEAIMREIKIQETNLANAQKPQK